MSYTGPEVDFEKWCSRLPYERTPLNGNEQFERSLLVRLTVYRSSRWLPDHEESAPDIDVGAIRYSMACDPD